MHSRSSLEESTNTKNQEAKTPFNNKYYSSTNTPPIPKSQKAQACGKREQKPKKQAFDHPHPSPRNVNMYRRSSPMSCVSPAHTFSACCLTLVLCVWVDERTSLTSVGVSCYLCDSSREEIEFMRLWDENLALGGTPYMQCREIAMLLGP